MTPGVRSTGFGSRFTSPEPREPGGEVATMIPSTVEIDFLDAGPVAQLCALISTRDPQHDLVDEQVVRAIELAQAAGARWSAIAAALRG